MGCPCRRPRFSQRTGAPRAEWGPYVPIEARPSGAGPAGWGAGWGRPRAGCGGLRWAVALDLLDLVFAPRPGGRSKECLGLQVVGVGGGLQQPLVWNGRLPSESRSPRSAAPKVELRMCGAAELWAGAAVAGTRPDGAFPPLCSAVLAGPTAFLC